MNFDEKLKENVQMSRYTTFGIGGPARYFIEAENIEELRELIKYSYKNEMNYFILGGGSNLLVSDEGISSLVIKNNCKNIKIEDGNICISSGNSIGEFVEFCLKNEFSGFEFLAGIPGTIGGAVCGNAGAYGKSMADILISVNIIDQYGNSLRLGIEEMEFSYRESRIKHSNEVITDVLIKLPHGDYYESKKKVDQFIEIRRKKHPGKNLGCAGSYFKNLPPENEGERRIAAGLLLENAGAKKIKVGDASVFEKHANMIVNLGNAKAVDVLEVANRMKKAVEKKYGIILVEEVRFIGKK